MNMGQIDLHFLDIFLATRFHLYGTEGIWLQHTQHLLFVFISCATVIPSSTPKNFTLLDVFANCFCFYFMENWITPCNLTSDAILINLLCAPAKPHVFFLGCGIQVGSLHLVCSNVLCRVLM